MVKADLHNHLRTSSRIYKRDFNKVIGIASERLGDDGIFGVADFLDDRYERFISMMGYERDYIGENKNGVYVPEKGVLVVKGDEVPTKHGHLLVLGLEYGKHLKENRTLGDTLKEAKDSGGIAIAVHPFHVDGLGPYLRGNTGLIEDIDAIEIYNGEASIGFPIWPVANEEAQDFYRDIKLDFPNLGGLSSSDGHSMYELGRNWTEILKPNIESKGDFVPSLRNSIRNTNLQTAKQMKSASFGAIDHFMDVIFISKILPRIGLYIEMGSAKSIK